MKPETPGIDAVVLCDVIADIQQVLPGLRRKADSSHPDGCYELAPDVPAAGSA